MSLPNLVMAVYRYTHPNGSSKIWCITRTNSGVETRWGKDGNALQSSVRADDMIRLIREKEAKGYVFQGDHTVSDHVMWTGTPEAQQPAPAPTVTPARKPDTQPTGIFHWTAEGMNVDIFGDVFSILASKVKPNHVFESGKDVKTIELDETTLEFRIRNGKARDSIKSDSGSWKAVLFLLAMGKHFTVNVVDDDGNMVSVRTLKQQTHLGFTPDEFEAFAERLGLINKAMAKAAASCFF